MPGLAVCRRYAEQGQNIIAMFNADMIGYQEAGKPIVLGFMVRDSAPPPQPNPPRDSTCSWVYESITIQVSNVLPSNPSISMHAPALVWSGWKALFVCVALRVRVRASRGPPRHNGPAESQICCLLLSVK